MRVLLDECMPRDFKKYLPGHECLTAPEAGLAGKKNGELIRAAAGRFDAMVTVDRKLRYQQNVARIPFGIVVLMALGNRLEDIAPLASATVTALQGIKPGMVVEVGV
jgi:hypothetical protein